MNPAILDAHTHLTCDHPDVLQMLESLHLKVMSVSVAQDSKGEWRQKARQGDAAYRVLGSKHGSRCAWCTSFDLPRFEDPDYAEKVIADLDEDFRDGAVAVKVWKNIGMQFKDPSGTYLMVDHPILKPVFDHLEKTGRTLMMHTGEPRAAWRPLDPPGPHSPYFRKNPQWHFFQKEGVPSYESLIQARDHVIQRHPRLRVVGAHLGSLEWDVREIAKRFDLYPNFAVDTSARVKDLVTQNRGHVCEFFEKYSDRILFGTDRVIGSFAAMKEDERKAAVQGLRDWYKGQIAYYSEDSEITGLERMEAGHRGLALREPVLRKFFETNAKTWYPGF